MLVQENEQESRKEGMEICCLIPRALNLDIPEACGREHTLKLARVTVVIKDFEFHHASRLRDDGVKHALRQIERHNTGYNSEKCIATG